MNKPLKGLLSLMLHGVNDTLAIIALACVGLGAAMLITGDSVFLNFFVMASICVFPYIVMMRMGGATMNSWERFQIAMPISRRDQVNSFYVGILLASVVGIPLVALVSLTAPLLHEGIFGYQYPAMAILVTTTAVYLSMPLVMAALIFPLAVTKLGEGRGELLFTICMFGAVGNGLLVPWLVNRFDLPMGLYLGGMLTLGVGVVAYVISYFITQRLYAKLDF